jgi:hypothetical protein
MNWLNRLAALRSPAHQWCFSTPPTVQEAGSAQHCWEVEDSICDALSGCQSSSKLPHTMQQVTPRQLLVVYAARWRSVPVHKPCISQLCSCCGCCVQGTTFRLAWQGPACVFVCVSNPAHRQLRGSAIVQSSCSTAGCVFPCLLPMQKPSQAGCCTCCWRYSHLVHCRPRPALGQAGWCCALRTRLCIACTSSSCYLPAIAATTAFIRILKAVHVPDVQECACATRAARQYLLLVPVAVPCCLGVHSKRCQQ